MIEINQLKVPCGSKETEIERKVRKLLRSGKEEDFSMKILRHSVDARKKPELYDIYTIGVELKGGIPREEKVVRKLRDNKIKVVDVKEYEFPAPLASARRLNGRPVIIGFGPAGIFCALELALHGFRPIVLERGRRMEDRVFDVEHFWETGELDPQSNIQFGEGGAGTFSDGKLNTGVKDKNGRNAYVLKKFTEAGAPEDITYEFHPHIGTDLLRKVIVNLRNQIIDLGGEVRFESEMTEILQEKGRVSGVRVKERNGNCYDLAAEIVVFAPGHSARNTIRTLFSAGIPMTSKNFAVGFRVSHPQSMIDERSFGISDPDEMKRLGLAHSSYKLTAQTASGRGVYSFCMCPGGYIVNASSENGRLAVNGMSDYARDSARANSAVIMTIGPAEFGSEEPLAGMYYQEMLEEKAFGIAEGRIPVESFIDFERAVTVKNSVVSDTDEKEHSMNCGDEDMKSEHPFHDEKEPVCPEREMSREEAEQLCLKGLASYAKLHELFSQSLSRDFVEGMHSFERNIPGFTGNEAYVCGLESRTSSPVRILRNEEFQSVLSGLYPCGEGAGYAGGITSAAIDGIKTAEKIGLFYLPEE